ncbi:hypothetical protein [Paenibacillus sp. Leaf72]|uniref:hypothetical protein n=1 Tax=Paenibacillus sp. Leaf72 TaxID=1736234 RepID=UPI0006F3E296|nr:hypothetical protein [Paenibacillus sp. Leaf72]KQO04817.1 hypothetical protein ASF12_33080 [Paenibacillus sp. Leaf72]
MECMPEYAANIIVGINNKNDFSWYVTDKSFWIMDLIKRQQEFLSNGYEYDMEHLLESRFFIKNVNEDTIDIYLENLSKYKTSSLELKKIIKEEKYDDTILSLNPSLFIDVDKKMLLSSFPEMFPFERYAPDNWIGEYKDFDDYIPDSEKYWLDEGVDLISIIYQKENE